MKKTFRLEEVNLPFNELALSDDEMFTLKGGMGSLAAGSGSGCGCGCGSGSGAGCGCGCGCSCDGEKPTVASDKPSLPPDPC